MKKGFEAQGLNPGSAVTLRWNSLTSITITGLAIASELLQRQENFCPLGGGGLLGVLLPWLWGIFFKEFNWKRFIVL